MCGRDCHSRIGFYQPRKAMFDSRKSELDTIVLRLKDANMILKAHDMSINLPVLQGS